MIESPLHGALTGSSPLNDEGILKGGFRPQGFQDFIGRPRTIERQCKQISHGSSRFQSQC
jgi:hypothetical protein